MAEADLMGGASRLRKSCDVHAVGATGWRGSDACRLVGFDGRTGHCSEQTNNCRSHARWVKGSTKPALAWERGRGTNRRWTYGKAMRPVGLAAVVGLPW